MISKEKYLKNRNKENAIYYKVRKKLKSRTQKHLLEELLNIICTNNADFLEEYYKSGFKDGMALICSIIKNS